MEWVAFFAAALALWQIRRLHRRVAVLEREVEDSARAAARLREQSTSVRDVEPRPAPPPRVAEAPPVEPPPVEPPASQGDNSGEPEAKSWATRIDWESWLGVRGAGALGGIVLALAGIYFFKYSIEHGLLSPAARVTLGVLVGLGCVAGSELVLRRRYTINANAVAGAGLVILYASFWAARALYALVPFQVAFVAMIAVTAAACALSVRHSSLLVAMLGLVGGFSTPLLLSTGEDRPIPLFGYILLLDAAVLFVAHKRRWPVLATVSLVLTFLYQAGWIFSRMGPEHLFLGLLIVGVFAAAYAIYARLQPARGSRLEAAALLLPFVFTLYFAGETDVSPRFYPLALLMALLLAASGVIARAHARPWLFTAAASATLGASALWLVEHHLTPALAWEAALLVVLLAAIAHVFVEREKTVVLGASVLAIGLQIFALIASASNPRSSPWPWFVAHAGLPALVLRQARFGWRLRLEDAAGTLLSLGVCMIAFSQAQQPTFPPMPVFMGLVLLLMIALHAVGSLWAAVVASATALLLALDKTFWLAHSTVFYHAYTLLLAVLGGIAAARLARGWAYLVVVAELALVHTLWMANTLEGEIALAPDASALPLQALSAVAMTAWPFFARRSFQRDSYAWYAAALAGPMWFHTLRKLFEARFGTDFIAVLPLTLGGVSLFSAVYATTLWPKQDPMRKTSLVWFGAVALCFVSVAIPLQLEKQWITIGWALEGAAVLMLWQRLDHYGLKYFGVSLLLAAAIRLSLNPAVLDYYARGEQRFFNWLLYSYWVPAACLLVSSVILNRLELARLSVREKQFYRRDLPWGAIVTGAACAVVFFAWINLAIADWFSRGDALELDFSRMPARELTRSICWALYALVLLGAGVWRQSRGLRWLSLVMLYVTIAKVFFWDLGELADLYRVMSLVGAAFALIAVSLGYQRFVFRREK